MRIGDLVSICPIECDLPEEMHKVGIYLGRELSSLRSEYSVHVVLLGDELVRIALRHDETDVIQVIAEIDAF
jgi:hypothetical protein